MKPLRIILIAVLGWCFSLVNAQDNNRDSVTFDEPANIEYTIPFNTKMSLGMFERKELVPKSRFLIDNPKPFVSLDFPRLPPMEKLTINENFNFLNLNYNNNLIYPLSPNTAFYLSNSRDVIPGLSAINSLSAGFLLQPADNWTISLSGTGMRYQDFTGLHNNISINGSSRIALSDRIGLNTYGGYTPNNGYNSTSVMLTPFQPRSYYGGTIDFRITDHWGVEAGMLQEFNVFTRKWERRYILSPKYYK